MQTLLSINNYNYVRGGAEYVFLEHNKIFEQAGWNVVPFAMHHSKNLSSEWSQHFVEEIEFGEAYAPVERVRKASKRSIHSSPERKLPLLSMRFSRRSHIVTISTIIYHHR